MRRADRLFHIIQILRRHTTPTTAAEIGRELEVSARTVYRDIADLVAQRVPIAGEAGYGYVLEVDYDMPPLMLTPDEIEAVVLGAQWVAARVDPTLSRAAKDVVAKIAAAVPERLRPYVLEPSVAPRPAAPTASDAVVDAVDASILRAAIRGGRKLHLTYRSGDGPVTERIVWPVVLGYAETSRTLVAWCELRGEFRHFRTERMLAVRMLDERYPGSAPGLRRRWQAWRETVLATPPASKS